MSRILLLVLLAVWMTRGPDSRHLEMETALRLGLNSAQGAAIFLGIYVLLVTGMILWARRLAGRIGRAGLGRTLDRFQRFLEYSRYFIVIWLGVGIYGGLQWGISVDWLLGHMGLSGHFLGHGEDFYVVPSLLLGTLPGLLAWMALWRAQYPIDLAMREQHILVRLNENLPVHRPPTWRQFFFTNLRLQMLFILAPALVLILGHDLTIAALMHMRSGARLIDAGLENWVMIPLAALLCVFAPELLRHIAHSVPLPDGALRRRLEEMFHSAGIGYRDILLWKTQNTMSNAFVMGLFARVRYVLLSDVLLETMSDRQIEAVFAHELGHVVHRHLWWLLVVCATVISFVSGPLILLIQCIPAHYRDGGLETVLNLGVAGGGVLMIIGLMSHRFERQADVFAARTMEREHSLELQKTSEIPVGGAARFLAGAGLHAAVQILNPTPRLAAAVGHAGAPRAASAESMAAPAAGPASRSRHSWAPSAGAVLSRTYVGEYGAEVFASALGRVADINNIPIHARGLLHPSIAKRMRYLRQMSARPALTWQFDRFMRRLFTVLFASFCVLAAWAVIASLRPDLPISSPTPVQQSHE